MCKNKSTSRTIPKRRVEPTPGLQKVGLDCNKTETFSLDGHHSEVYRGVSDCSGAQARLRKPAQINQEIHGEGKRGLSWEFKCNHPLDGIGLSIYQLCKNTCFNVVQGLVSSA